MSYIYNLHVYLTFSVRENIEKKLSLRFRFRFLTSLGSLERFVAFCYFFEPKLPPQPFDN